MLLKNSSEILKPNVLSNSHFCLSILFAGLKKKDFCAKDNKVEIICIFSSFRGCEWMNICF